MRLYCFRFITEHEFCHNIYIYRWLFIKNLCANILKKQNGQTFDNVTISVKKYPDICIGPYRLVLFIVWKCQIFAHYNSFLWACLRPHFKRRIHNQKQIGWKRREGCRKDGKRASKKARERDTSTAPTHAGVNQFSEETEYGDMCHWRNTAVCSHTHTHVHAHMLASALAHTRAFSWSSWGVNFTPRLCECWPQNAVTSWSVEFSKPEAVMCCFLSRKRAFHRLVPFLAARGPQRLNWMCSKRTACSFWARPPIFFFISSQSDRSLHISKLKIIIITLFV